MRPPLDVRRHWSLLFIPIKSIDEIQPEPLPIVQQVDLWHGTSAAEEWAPGSTGWSGVNFALRICRFVVQRCDYLGQVQVVAEVLFDFSALA
jgi:hypothetical protein